MFTGEPKSYQYSFNKDFFVAPILDKNHLIIKISDKIDFIGLSERLKKFYCSGRGRPSKPIRAMIGLLILKHLYNCSDVEVTDMLRRDLYAQYLCGLSFKQAHKFINASTLTKFRKRIGREGIKIIEEEVIRCLRKMGLVRGRKMICDTTIVRANIKYPTDIRLLEQLREKAVKIIDKARQYTQKRYRTYKRKAKAIYMMYEKIRKKSKKMIKKVKKKMIQYTSRNIRQLEEVIGIIKEEATERIGKEVKKIIEEGQRLIEIGKKIIEQQKKLNKGEKVKGRIVSIHQEEVRPMVRGKYPEEVEFGPKILIGLKGSAVYLGDIMNENISDHQLIECAVEGYREKFGGRPVEVNADRGFWSKKNYEKLKQMGIKKVGIEVKGKDEEIERQQSKFMKRVRRERNRIEAKISLGKRKYGLDRIRYKGKEGKEMWVRLSLIGMNLSMVGKYG